MFCHDCMHKYCCKYDRFFGFDDVENKCNYFKKEDNFIELPYNPFPVVLSDDENNSDVYCPFCSTNLSGHYYGGDYESPQIVPCFECGTWLNGAKAITKEEAEMLKK